MTKILSRPDEIKSRFMEELGKHLLEVVSGQKDIYYEIHDLVKILHIHPANLSNRGKHVTGKSKHPHYISVME